MLGLLGAMGQLIPEFGSEDPLAPVDQAHWYHRQMTQEVAEAAGWSPGAARDIGWHCVGVDLFEYHPAWCVLGGRKRLRGAMMSRSSLEKLHFDNLAHPDQVAVAWQRIVGGSQAAILWAAERDDVIAARHVTGVSLHAIQDFYSHSTWINAPSRRDHTWLESATAVVPADVRTGTFGPGADPDAPPHGDSRLTLASVARIPGLVTPVLAQATSRIFQVFHRPLPRGIAYHGRPGINLDSRWQAATGVRTRGLDRPGDEEGQPGDEQGQPGDEQGQPSLDGDAGFELAIALARRETDQWLTALETFCCDAGLGDFWRRVAGDDTCGWTTAFEDPGRRAHEFLSAGTYPPAPGVSEAGTVYLRVTLAGRRGSRPISLLGADGERLASELVRTGRVVTIGPVPAGTVAVSIPGRDQPSNVEAFTRAPAPSFSRLTSDPGPDQVFRLPEPFRVAATEPPDTQPGSHQV